jgi:hypothetical protein
MYAVTLDRLWLSLNGRSPYAATARDEMRRHEPGLVAVLADRPTPAVKDMIGRMRNVLRHPVREHERVAIMCTVAPRVGYIEDVTPTSVVVTCMDGRRRSWRRRHVFSNPVLPPRCVDAAC